MSNEKFYTSQVTLTEMRDEIKREVSMRQRVYPQWIIGGKISAATAAYRVLVLESIQVYLQNEIKKTDSQKELF